MSGRDDWVRDRLARLDPPPRRPGFEEELWQRLEGQERSLARRWRLTSIALAAVAAAAISAAAVLATAQGTGATVDRTVSCATQVQGGLHVFEIQTFLKGPQFPTSGVQIMSQQQLLVGFNTLNTEPLIVDTGSCRPVKRRFPLTAAKLPSAGTFTPGYTNFSARCPLGGRVLVRVRLGLDAQGRPRHALVAVRMEKGNRPVAFLQWSAKRVTASIIRACD
jgi:hypothetical protein